MLALATLARGVLARLASARGILATGGAVGLAGAIPAAFAGAVSGGAGGRRRRRRRRALSASDREDLLFLGTMMTKSGVERVAAVMIART